MKLILTILTILFTLSLSAKDKKRIDEILLTGDGASFESAYKVYNVDEQYYTLTSTQKTPIIQMLMAYKNELYDVFTDSKTGKNIYFKIVKPNPVSEQKKEGECL